MTTETGITKKKQAEQPRVIRDARELVEGEFYRVRNRRTDDCSLDSELFRLTEDCEALESADCIISVGIFDDKYEALPVTLPQWPEAE